MPSIRALMRSRLTSPEAAAAVMRDHLSERADVLARSAEHADAHVRAALVVSSLLGITVARHFLELPALRDADGATAARLLGQLLD